MARVSEVDAVEVCYIGNNKHNCNWPRDPLELPTFVYWEFFLYFFVRDTQSYIVEEICSLFVEAFFNKIASNPIITEDLYHVTH